MLTYVDHVWSRVAPPRPPSSSDYPRRETGEGQIPGQLWVPPVVQEVFWRQLRRARVRRRPDATGPGDDAGSAQPRYASCARRQLALSQVTGFVSSPPLATPSSPLTPGKAILHKPKRTPPSGNTNLASLCAPVFFFFSGLQSDLPAIKLWVHLD